MCIPVLRGAGAIHHARCGGARTRDGLHRQNFEVRGLRERLRFHCGRAALFSRQTIQERPEALQELQSQARIGRRRGSLRDANRLFGVWDGNNGAIQTDTGPSRPLQAVLSAKANAPGQLNPRNQFRLCAPALEFPCIVAITTQDLRSARHARISSSSVRFAVGGGGFRGPSIAPEPVS
jgi:hypothetical protein